MKKITKNIIKPSLTQDDNMSELESSTQLNHDLEELSSNNSEIAETSEKNEK